MSEPVGLCYTCGQRGLVMRMDRKGRPYLVCRWCATRVFAQAESGPHRWLARAVLDAEQTDGKLAAAVLFRATQIVEWASASPSPVGVSLTAAAAVAAKGA